MIESRVIDLRSDTVTRPSEGMRDAMMAAPLGDDVFGDDPTVNALQEKAAALLGKERGLFVPSGTMANQLALRAHTRSGDEVICHAGAHIRNYESGAAAGLAGVQLHPIVSEDGSLPIDALKAAIHQTEDPHYAPTTLICIEDTHNGCGGVVVPADNVRAVSAIAADRGIPLHLDGARVFNAATSSGRSVRDMAAPFHTISFCLSKGLGAPVGSLLVGDADTIARAYRYRKMYGGGMRQAGILAAAGIYALDHHVAGLRDDHARAQRLAGALDKMPGLRVALDRVQSNLVYFDLEQGHALGCLTAAGVPLLVQRLEDAGVLITGSTYRLRAVAHRDVSDGDITRVLEAFERVMGSV